ncbi:MAG: hypothetical protein AAGF93_02560, partial [Cyanobacteria bacterium P01_H01_bin.105]
KNHPKSPPPPTPPPTPPHAQKNAPPSPGGGAGGGGPSTDSASIENPSLTVPLKPAGHGLKPNVRGTSHRQALQADRLCFNTP